MTGREKCKKLNNNCYSNGIFSCPFRPLPTTTNAFTLRLSLVMIDSEDNAEPESISNLLFGDKKRQCPVCRNKSLHTVKDIQVSE